MLTVKEIPPKPTEPSYAIEGTLTSDELRVLAAALNYAGKRTGSKIVRVQHPVTLHSVTVEDVREIATRLRANIRPRFSLHP